MVVRMDELIRLTDWHEILRKTNRNQSKSSSSRNKEGTGKVKYIRRNKMLQKKCKYTFMYIKKKKKNGIQINSNRIPTATKE